MKRIFLILLFLGMAFNAMAYTEASALKAVKKYQKIAKAALDELDTDKAKKNLLQSISLIESYKLSEKEFADIYILAGVLNLMIEDGGDAVGFFKKALELDPSIKIPKNFSSEDVEAVFKKAKETQEKTDETFTFDTVNYRIFYTAPKTHNKNQPLNLKVDVKPLPPSGYDVQVMFISGTNKEFESLKLTRSKDNEYIGIIPSLGIPKDTLKLYVLMIDNDMNPVAMAGSESKPFEIKIIESNSMNSKDLDLDLDDNKTIDTKNKKNKLPVKEDFPLLSFNMEVGTGLGIAHGDPLYTSLKIDPGLAWSPAWIAPELSFYITPTILIGVTSRIQIVERAWNLSLKGQILIYDTKSYKLFTDFGAGYGQVKYRVDVSNAYPEQGNDIVLHGDLFLWSGLSIVFMFNENIGFITSTKVNLILPDISILMDLGAGIYLEF
jgi:tetratricopeptide (TPR) repeat protein